MTIPAPESLRRALARRFLTATARGQGARPLVADPEQAAEVAMSVFIPVLEARDAEIERLKAECDSLRNRPGERAIRADERWRCAEWLRDVARERDVTTTAMIMRLADTLCPKSGSEEGRP